MYYVCKPRRVAIYVNTGRKSAAQIKKELGCDALLNGGLYDMQKFVPYCWLKVDGITLHSEMWSDWGIAWNNDAIEMDSSYNIGYYENFISCVTLIQNNRAVKPLLYDSALGGRRGRSAIGLKADGKVLLYCTQDGGKDAMTPEQLQTEMQKLGCVSAIMLDGGGSSQCIFPNGSIASQRIVQNYIAIWTEKPSEQSNPQCPYAEPIGNIRWGSIGSGAKWVQWQLNRHGASLDVDGLFFSKSVAALKDFQRANGLTADGICGAMTRGKLK